MLKEVADTPAKKCEFEVETKLRGKLKCNECRLGLALIAAVEKLHKIRHSHPNSEEIFIKNVSNASETVLEIQDRLVHALECPYPAIMCRFKVESDLVKDKEED